MTARIATVFTCCGCDMTTVTCHMATVSLDLPRKYLALIVANRDWNKAHGSIGTMVGFPYILRLTDCPVSEHCRSTQVGLLHLK